MASWRWRSWVVHVARSGPATAAASAARRRSRAAASAAAARSTSASARVDRSSRAARPAGGRTPLRSARWSSATASRASSAASSAASSDEAPQGLDERHPRRHHPVVVLDQRGAALGGELAVAVVELRSQGVDLAAQRGRPLAGGGRHLLVDLQPEQLAQRRLAVGRAVVEEVGEPALRQHDGAVELVDVEPEQPGDLGRHRAGVGGEDLVAPLQPGLLRRGAVPRPLDQAHGRVALLAELEVEADPGPRARLVDDRGDGAVVLVAGDAAVERERDGVDDRRLAGAGVADERHELDVGEVDRAGVTERAEALQLETERPHGVSASSSSSPNSVRTRSSTTPSPARYSSNSSWGLRPRWSRRRWRRPPAARPGGRRRRRARAARGRRRPARPGAVLAPRRAATGRRRRPARRAPRSSRPASAAVGRAQRHGADVGRDAGRDRDDVDLLDLLALAEVELQRRPAVVQRRPGRDPLRTVEVAERAVADRRGERLGRDGVLVDEVGRPFPTARLGAEHERVGGQHVDRVLVEAGAERLDEQAQPIAVALGVLERLGVHQVGGPHDAPLGHERQHGHPHRRAVAGRQVEHPAVVGSGRLGHQLTSPSRSNGATARRRRALSWLPAMTATVVPVRDRASSAR